jgi:hypothetical protein
MTEMRCEAGCKSFTGGERQHRRDCAFYPESLTKLWHDTEDALITEIARLRSAPGWQPIETAPKDGTIFMAFEQCSEAQRYECWWGNPFIGDTRLYWMDWADSEVSPTHWMPLHAAPEA